MKPGDLVGIRPNAHGYPDGWKIGEDPVRFTDGTTGILLEILPPDGYETRTFLKVLTPIGCVSIHDRLVRIIQ